MTSSQFPPALDYFCFGELLWDCFPDGERVAAGAPFHVAVHLARWGFRGQLASAVGSDALGTELEERALALLPRAAFPCHPTRATGTSVIGGTVEAPSFNLDMEAAWAHYGELDLEGAPRPRVVLYGSLAAWSLKNRKWLRQWLAARSPELVVCDLNLRAPHYDCETMEFCLRHCHLLKGSESEVREVLPHGEEQELQPAIERFATKRGLRGVLVTRGSDPAALLWDGQWHHGPKPQRVAIADCVGAGDAFMARWLAGYLRGEEQEARLAGATRFATAVCTVRGGLPGTVLPF